MIVNKRCLQKFFKFLDKMAAEQHVILLNGAKMPSVGLGTWQATNSEELEKALEAALEAGYRHLDTAFAYQNEAVIGKVLQRWFNDGKVKREDLFITTKLPTTAIDADLVEQYLNKSLENLQVAYVDLYLIHFPVCVKRDDKTGFAMDKDGNAIILPTDHKSVWKKLEEQVDAGKTKAIGVSNFNIRQITNILNIARIKPACHQFESHVYLQQNKLVDFCKQNNIAIVAYSPLGNPSYNDFLKSRGFEVTKKLHNLMEDPVVFELANKHKKSPVQILLRFLLERGLVPIPKSVSPKRLGENINLFDFKLDNEDMNKLRALDKGEDGRVCDFKAFKGIDKSPEFPWSDN